MVFTNYSGPISGEFEGFLLNGASGYEGSLDATYTDFQYGGGLNAILNLGEDAVLVLYNCSVLYSESDGIATTDDGSSVELSDCEISYNAGKLLNAQHSLSDLLIDITRGIGNGDGPEVVDIGDGEPGPRADIFGLIVDGGENFDTGIGLFLGPESGGCRIENCEFYNFREIGICVNFGDGGDCFPKIRNTIVASALVEAEGILFYNIRPDEVGRSYGIYNCVIWDIDQGTGIKIEFDGTPQDWDEWDVNLFLQNNIIGECAQGVETEGNHSNFYIGDPNAFKVCGYDEFNGKDNDNDGMDFTNVIIHEDGDAFEFVTEENTEEPPYYDLHLQWLHPQNHLVNAGDSDEDCGMDSDNSQTNLGVYGGTRGNRPNYGFEHYVAITAGAELPEDPDWNSEYLEVALLRDTYRAFGDISVPYYNEGQYPDLESDTKLTIEEGTIINFMNDGQLSFPGILECLGSPDNHIAFQPLEGHEWGGLISMGLGEPGFPPQNHSKLLYVDIKDVQGGDGVGLLISNTVNDEEEPVSINYCTISGCADKGFYLVNTTVSFRGCEIVDNWNFGGYLTFGDFNYIAILGCLFSGNSIIDPGLNSSALFVSGAIDMPCIGWNDELPFNTWESRTRIVDNGEYGIWMGGAVAPILAGTPNETLGYALISGNGDDQIMVSGVDGAPLLDGGHNDILYSLNPPTYSIYNGNAPQFSIDAADNYWGSDDPEADEDFIFDGSPVNYSPWDEFNSCPDEPVTISPFNTALHYLMSGNPQTVERSIPLFEELASDRRLGSRRANSLMFLRHAYKVSELDFSELRDFYSGFAAETENRSLSILSSRLSVWCWVNEGDFEQAIERFASLRRNANRRVDSLTFALDEATVLYLAGSIDDMPASNLDGELASLRRMEELCSSIELESRRMSGELASSPMPAEFTIQSLYPNPFNSTLHLSFSLSRAVKIDCRIYDLNGRLMDAIVQGNYSLGKHDILWDAGGFAAGMYLIQFDTINSRHHSPVVLLK